MTTTTLGDDTISAVISEYLPAGFALTPRQRLDLARLLRTKKASVTPLEVRGALTVREKNTVPMHTLPSGIQRSYKRITESLAVAARDERIAGRF